MPISSGSIRYLRAIGMAIGASMPTARTEPSDISTAPSTNISQTMAQRLPRTSPSRLLTTRSGRGGSSAEFRDDFGDVRGRGEERGEFVLGAGGVEAVLDHGGKVLVGDDAHPVVVGHDVVAGTHEVSGERDRAVELDGLHP